MRTNFKQKWIVAGLVMAVAGGLGIERAMHKNGGQGQGLAPSLDHGENAAAPLTGDAVEGSVGAPGAGKGIAKGTGASGGASAGAGLAAGGGAIGLGGGVAASGGPGAPPAVEAAKPATGCESVTFAAKGAQKFTQNLLKLPVAEQRPNADTVCVKVDGLPVRFSLDKKKLEVTLGSVRKADSRVTVSYCVGKAKCGDPCVVPRDEFMEALAGGDEDAEDAQNPAGWADAGSKEEQELDQKLAGFNQVLTDERVKGVNTGWVVENRSDACEGRLAKK